MLPIKYFMQMNGLVGWLVKFPTYLSKDGIIDLFRLGTSSLSRTEQAMDDGLSEMTGSSGSVLCPQACASYNGLRKLLEKDWTDNEDVMLGVNISFG